MLAHKDGESLERGWALANPVAPRTREMGPQLQRAVFNDHLAEESWQELCQELAKAIVPYKLLVCWVAVYADLCLIRLEDTEPPAVTSEDEGTAVEAEEERRWANIVRMCMAASTPSARREWEKDQRDQERQEEYQRLANLQQPSKPGRSAGGRAGSGQAYIENS